MQRVGISSARDIEDAFARLVREHRQEKGWSQKKLADALATRGLVLDPTAITRIEKEGTRSIRLGEAVLIAEVLGIDLRDDLEDTAHRVAKLRQQANHHMHEARRALELWVSAVGELNATLRQDPKGVELLNLPADSKPTSVDQYLQEVHGRLANTDWRRVSSVDPIDVAYISEAVELLTRNLIAADQHGEK